MNNIARVKVKFARAKPCTTRFVQLWISGEIIKTTVNDPINKLPLPNKRLLSNKRPFYAVKILLDARL